jgi:hypothetical protein
MTRHSFYGWVKRSLSLFLALTALSFVVAVAQDSKSTKAKAGSDFLRFTEDEKQGRLEAAIVRYKHPDGQTVDLIAAIHVGDTAYFEALNKRFESYQALLYEMVGNPEDLKDAEKLAAQDNPMRMLQRMVKTMLKLDYQLDAIDYTKANFVHADLRMEEFVELQDSRGENIFSLVQNAMRKTAEEGNEELASQLQFDLAPFIRALSSRDSASALKLLVAQQFDKAEELIDAIESDEDGTALLTGRNKHVMKVLGEQLAAGKKKLGVFYGAAHLVDLERRLHDLGYKKSNTEWLTAWDIPKPQPKPDPGADAAAPK